VKQIRGLTLQGPWDYFIFQDKDVENRTWQPPADMIGHYLAIHVGQGYDDEGARWIQKRFGVEVPGLTLGMKQRKGVIVGVVRLAGVVTQSDSPWFFGPFGWQLEDKVAIEPVKCSGKLKLWELPDDVLEQVRVNWLAAKRAA
jgi:hypothetical protein